MVSLPFWTIWSSTVLASAELVKLDFTRTPVAGAPLRHRSLDLPIANDLPHQRYAVHVAVGNPPQPASILIDTGSSDFWLPDPNSSGCAPNCPAGSFDAAKSSTFKAARITFNASVGLTPDNILLGQYCRDTVRIGAATLPDMTLAICNVTKLFFSEGFWGIAGLGARLGQTVFTNPASPFFGNPNATFATLYDQLHTHGYTARRAFSIWLNSISATTGRIIFGGVDTTKYHGDLIPVPVQLTHGRFFDWAITLSSVARYSSSTTMEPTKKEPLTAPNFTATVILDSGAPNMYLPTALATAIATAMNATTYLGFPYVACSLRKPHPTLEFTLGDHPDTGPRITVPYSALIYPSGDPANIGPVTAPDGTPLCYLGVIGTPGPIFLLGDTFIRSAYLVYDVDNLVVAMAQARSEEDAGEDEGNVVPLPAGTGYPGR